MVVITAKFCPNCGSEINEKAEICPKCGNSLSSTKPEIKKTDKSIGKSIVYGIALIIISAIIAAFVFGMGSPTPSKSQTSTQIEKSLLITKSVSEIGLKIDDLSTGWMGSGDGNETYYSATFDKERFGIFHTVESIITKYPTIDQAKEAFNKLKKDNLDFKIVSVGLGDESFAWEFGKESTVVFRKANIIVETWYGKQAGSGSIGDAKDYAEIIEKKI